MVVVSCICSSSEVVLGRGLDEVDVEEVGSSLSSWKQIITVMI